jgi:hypothetical protein
LRSAKSLEGRDVSFRYTDSGQEVTIF